MRALNPRNQRAFVQAGETRLIDPTGEPPLPIYESQVGNFGPFQHQVVATDYTNFAFLWGCEPIDGTNDSFENYVLLTREPGMQDFSPALTQRIENLIDQFIDRTALITMAQDQTT